MPLPFVIDNRDHKLADVLAKLLAAGAGCPLDVEPRYIGDQDVFALQEQVVDQILFADSTAAAKAAATPVIDPIQQTLAEELKDALRRQTVDREFAKRVIRFLGQPMGRALHVKFKGVYENWTTTRDDGALLEAAVVMADEFGKERPMPASSCALRREDLTLVCFEYVSG